jgi:hypothetical protein
MHREAMRRYFRTWSPWYDPAAVDVPPSVPAQLARSTAAAEHVRS